MEQVSATSEVVLNNGVQSGGNNCANIGASIHDQTQIELDFEYLLSKTHTTLFHSQVDLYFFLPNSMGIHASSYGRDQFYNDLTNYIRLRTPDSPGGGSQLLEALHRYFDSDLSSHEREKLVPLAVQQVKLFGNRVNTLLKNLHTEVDSHSCTTDRGPSPSSFKEYQMLIQEIQDEILFYQKSYVTVAAQDSLILSRVLQQAIVNTDEFLTHRTISTFSAILLKLKQCKARNCCFANLTEMAPIEPLLQSLVRHRKDSRYLTLETSKSENELEYFYYRQGLLKKFLSRPLHLSKQISKQEKVYRNWIAGAGAGLAGLWAQVADYQAHRLRGAQDIGLSFITIASVAILAYIFKDRIKDISKDYFNERLKTYLPDFKTLLYYSYFGPQARHEKVSVGSCDEYMRYLNSRTCPEDIFYVRKLKGRRDIGDESLDTILHYSKSVKINPTSLLESIPGVFGVKDILRFNFNYFQDHLDDPQKVISTFDIEDGPCRISAPKVYHINAVVKVTTQVGAQGVSPGNRKNHVSFAHYRLVINKKEIVRVEQVSAPSELNYATEN